MTFSFCLALSSVLIDLLFYSYFNWSGSVFMGKQPEILAVVLCVAVVRTVVRLLHVLGALE